jgi:amino acid transporter
VADEVDNAGPTPLQAVRAYKIVHTRKLKWWDVSALIVNKMIGTGIFTGPPTILMYTGKKSTALGLWAAGFAYTLISTFLYLEYSRKLPYTGGELIYLDEIFSRPALLSYTCYAFYFVFFYTTATNSMQFARQVIIAATNNTDDSDERVMRFIAVVITTVVCLLLYFSTAAGRRFNRYLAWLKISMLISIGIAGAVKASRATAEDITKSFQTTPSNSAPALLQILFSFQGWENATLVAGEIPDNKTLRKGFIRAVWIVGLLYMFVNIVYCYAIPWNVDGIMTLEYVPLFFGNSKRAQEAWAILTALSAVGSIISVTYTCVRVKQTIAWTNILPWSPFLRTSAPMRSRGHCETMEMRPLIPQSINETSRPQPTLRIGTPQGGIVLHWVVCVFYICISAAIPAVTEAISFPGLLVSYGHAIVGAIIGLFFPKFRTIEYKIPKERRWDPGELPRWLRPKPSQYLLGLVSAAGNIVILVLAAIGPYKNADGTTRAIKGWYFTVTSFGLLAFSVAYYAIFLASETSTGVQIAGVNLKRQQHGDGDNLDVTRQCEVCVYREPGVAHRHARDGYLYYNELKFPVPDKGTSFLYLIFGGPKERHHPSLHLRDYVASLCGEAKRILDVAWARMQGLEPSPKP